MSRPDAERLARGALQQQGAQVVRMAGGLVVLTIVARELTLPELGTYALLLSLITYVQFVKSSVTNAAVVAVAETAGDEAALSRVASTGFAIYAALGLASGLVLLGAGLLALPLFNIPEELEGTARAGVVGLATVTALGWPVQVFDDLLRGMQRFAAVSAVEIAAMVAFVAGAIALIAGDAPLWALVTWTAATPLLTGVACALVIRRAGVRFRLGRRYADRAEARRFGSASGLLIVGGLADLVVFSLDRAILASIRSPLAVGRYEGPLQMHNSLRYLHGVLTAPVVPAAAGYLSAGDRARAAELFTRALRYTLAMVVPLAVVLAIQAGPIMTLWLGPKFAAAADAATLFVAWWAVGANLGVAGAFLYAARRFALAAKASWAMAAVNLAITLSLTPSVGIYGPIAGALAGFAVQLAVLFPASMRVAGVSWSAVAREAWLPAAACGGAVALALLGAKQLLDLTGAGAALASLALVPLAYWGLFALAFARPDELSLARRVLQRRA